MDKAQLFNRQMLELFGEKRSLAETFLWFSSVSLGIIFCKMAYDITEAVFSRIKVYKALKRDQQIEWNNRGFSTAHAVLVSAVAGYLLVFTDFFSDSAPYGPVVFRSSIFSQMILGISIGYFISDICMILWCFPALGGWVYVVHHLLSMISLGLALHSGYAHIYLYLVMFTEFTTPFVNLRWYLSMAGRSKSSAYILNGAILFLTWLVFRVLLFVYFFVHIYRHFHEVKQVHAAGFYFLFIAPPTLAVLNLFWFQKITCGLLKTLFRKRSTL